MPIDIACVTPQRFRYFISQSEPKYSGIDFMNEVKTSYSFALFAGIM